MILGVFNDFSSQIMVGYLLGSALKYFFLLAKFYEAFKLAIKLNKVEELQFNKISEIFFFYFLVDSSNFLCGFKVNFLETNIFCFLRLSNSVGKVASCKFPTASVRLIASCNFPIASDRLWLTFSILCNPPLHVAYAQSH